MKVYLAPMEGITGYVYRNAFHKCFTDADKYFIPFIVPHTKRDFNEKERKELLPAHNEGMHTVPQILTKSAEDFLSLSEVLKDMGYREVNLNAGCPSGTVVSKNRGAGLLKDPEFLNRFLDGIFSKTDLKVSVKTRIGMEDREEFYDLLSVYNRYPLHELIIHPRVRKDFYKNRPDFDMFAYALEYSRNPVVYNGDLWDKEAVLRFEERFPEAKTVMIGRGVLRNPGLIGELKGEEKADPDRLKAFHDELLHSCEEELGGGSAVLFRMKELWSYMGESFPGSDKALKKIRKAKNLSEYRSAVQEIFKN